MTTGPGPRFASATVVEDGSGLPDANSYVGAYEADLWFSNDPGTVEKWDALTAGQKEWVLRKASALVDQLVEWRGSPSVVGQAMAWPRTGCADSGRPLRPKGTPQWHSTWTRGWEGPSSPEWEVVAADVVPDEIRQAVIETALALAAGDKVRAAGETRWAQISVPGAVSLVAETDRSTTQEAKLLMPPHARRLAGRFGAVLESSSSVRTRRLSRG